MGAGGQNNLQQRPVFPDYTRNVALRYVKRGYALIVNNFITLFLLYFAATLVGYLAKMYQQGELLAIWTAAQQTNLQLNLVSFIGSVFLLATVISFIIFRQSNPVYLITFHCFKPPEREMQVTYEDFNRGTELCGKFKPENVEFQKKVLTRSGLGGRTYLPPCICNAFNKERCSQGNDYGFTNDEDFTNMRNARKEAEMVMFGAVKNALEKSKLKPSQIGILVVNCSLFSPTPSLSAMIINHFKMNENIISYNLSGMGCSAGLIAIDLARQLLQNYSNSYALVVSTENITQNWYFGNDKSMLLPNCLFRTGCSAVVLSNKRSDRWRAKYALKHVVRTHMGANDEAYSCVYEMEDDQGVRGVRLTKELMAVAGIALKNNVTTLGPMVLPISEQLLFFVNLIQRKVFRQKVKGYIPDFKTAFDHICIHTGGKKVVQEIEKQLNLTKDYVDPTYECLERYGNLSSSSVWYTLANMEHRKGIRRGQKIWQLGFGSGFKCNSAVWVALRNNNEKHSAWLGYEGLGEPLNDKEVVDDKF